LSSVSLYFVGLEHGGVTRDLRLFLETACSRRRFLHRSGAISAAFLAAQPRSFAFPGYAGIGRSLDVSTPAVTCVDGRFHPHYRLPSPLEGILDKVDPARDAFPAEIYGAQIERVLATWTRGFLASSPDLSVIRNCCASSIMASPPGAATPKELRKETEFYIERRTFGPPVSFEREVFIHKLAEYLGFESGVKLLQAEFKLVEISRHSSTPAGASTRVRYDLVGAGQAYHRQEKIGFWNIDWQRSDAGDWAVTRWEFTEETLSRAAEPLFADISDRVLGGCSSYRQQLLPGTDHWRTVLDAASGIDVYGNYGITAGDIDNDAFDDLYVCEPSGLPNRLYRNTGKGTFEDVTERAGVGVIDSTPSALFADINNDGYQDLIVVREAGPLLFLNRGDGTFKVKPDAFHFSHQLQGSFTAAALADYDRDGWLDIYFCLYSYYQGPNRYRYPLPYFDAENGPPNFFLKNNRDGTFRDVTDSSGLNKRNNRYSFACGWCDYNQDGWPDLFVANDFGKKNLYRNNGDGTFTDVSPEVGVEDAGAGMSVCWFDYDNDGKMDVYIANMWTAAGQRITMQPDFKKNAPENARRLFRKHSMGNSLFRQSSEAKFEDATFAAGAGYGGWAWSSDSWDFDHDGYADLYIANGMISGLNRSDLSSFFWRQVVSRSPVEQKPSTSYEDGWGAINELIRADGTWSGYERNVFYVNNHDRTFSDISGISGLDFVEDSRSFALADFDHDGRLEVFLKNRGGPQVRVLRNVMQHLGDAVAFRLRGVKSNRDAIGAKIVVETEALKQTKFLQAGSGFLSQHTKELFFGLGQNCKFLKATIHWPNGAIQHFAHLPANHSISVTEESEQFSAQPFALDRPAAPAIARRPKPLTPATIGTWLVAPLVPPTIDAEDFAGKRFGLDGWRGNYGLLVLWACCSRPSLQLLRDLRDHQLQLSAAGLQIAGLNVEGPSQLGPARDLAKKERFAFTVAMLPPQQAAVYNLLFRYLFDRHRDLDLPTSFLFDADGMIVKVYQGVFGAAHLRADAGKIPRTTLEQESLALPFPGSFFGGDFLRSYLTYGVAFAQRGYLDAAEAAFLRAVSQDPRSALAHYSLGTLDLQKGNFADARNQLRLAVKLKPDYLLSLNNLGVLAAQQRRFLEAGVYFQEVLKNDPNNLLAIENLAEIDRDRGYAQQAHDLLARGLRVAPRDPDLNYKMGMLYAESRQNDLARKYLELAVQLRPNFPKAANNLGVLYLLTGHADLAVAIFRNAIAASPDYDQPYLNLARLYASAGKNQAAIKILRQLLARRPQHPLAEKMLDELQHR
jgi:tetratricopeptide (TPR) repeat protein